MDCRRRPGVRSRRQGIHHRLADLAEVDGHLADALAEAALLARALPGRGWRQRLAASNPDGPAEAFLAEVRQQVQARSHRVDPLYSLECPVNPPVPGLLPAAEALRAALGQLLAPLRQVVHDLTARLEDEAAYLDTPTRQRFDSLRRSIERRALQTLQGWKSMLRALTDGPAPEFVDWLEITRFRGQEFDVGLHRHWIDPMVPFARTVLEPAHGVLITSATLRDEAGDAVNGGWGTAQAVTGTRHLTSRPQCTAIASPFDYPRQTCVLVVDDVDRDDPRQVAAALRALFIAAGGGALGLFTAISRLRAVWRLLAGPLEEAGLRLLAQHMDPLDTGTLVDIFRAEENTCLLGTDALREDRRAGAVAAPGGAGPGAMASSDAPPPGPPGGLRRQGLRRSAHPLEAEAGLRPAHPPSRRPGRLRRPRPGPAVASGLGLSARRHRRSRRPQPGGDRGGPRPPRRGRKRVSQVA